VACQTSSTRTNQKRSSSTATGRRKRINKDDFCCHARHAGRRMHRFSGSRSTEGLCSNAFSFRNSRRPRVGASSAVHKARIAVRRSAFRQSSGTS
jgi:hypothetical protein